MLPKVLVVDHHENKRLWLEKILGKAGYEVVCLQGSEKALEDFEAFKPDAVILTMTLPVISGSELCKKLKKTELGGDIPIVLTSPLFKNMDMGQVAQKRWNVDSLLEEPYTKNILLKSLDEQLALYAKKREDARDEDAEEIDPFSHLKDEEIDPLEAMLAAADLVAEGIEQDETLRLTKSKRKKKTELKSEPTFGQEDMAIEAKGALRDTSIPEIISAIFFAKKTGILTVSVNSISKEVFFRDGAPIFVKSALREETLGEVLIKNGLITEQQRTRTLQSMAEKNLRQGDALIDIGALSATELYQALKLQSNEKIVGLFTWRDGQYEFEEKEISTEGITVFDMWTPLLVLQGVLRHYEAPDIREILNELKDFVLTRRDNPPVAFEKLRFPKEVKSFIELVDGHRTLAQVVSDSPLDLSRTYQVLFALLIMEQFGKIDPGRKGTGSRQELPTAGISLDSLIVEVFGRDAAATQSEPAELVADLADQLEPDSVAKSVDVELPDVSDDAPVDAHDDSEDIQPYSKQNAQNELAGLFAQKDAASGKWEAPQAGLAPKEETSSTGRVAFDLDDDDDDLSPVEEAEKDTGETIEKLREKAKKEVDEALDDFLLDVGEKADDPDVMEETIRITMEDLKIEKDEDVATDEAESEEAGEGGGQDNKGGATLLTALDAQKERMSPEDREILDTLLADCLNLSKSNYYEILHISNEATEKVIRDAYTRLVKKYHPDKIQSRFDKEVIDKAGELIKQATEAYRTLSNFKKRKEYDRDLATTGGKKEQRSIGMILKAENEFVEGMSEIRHMRWQQAKEHFEAAIELLPEEGEYHGYLGRSTYNLTNQPLGERTRKAREFLEKAVRLNPRSDISFYFLGMLLKDNDMFDKAALMFAQAFRINKNNFKAKNQLIAIQALRSSKPKGAPRPGKPRRISTPVKTDDNLLNRDINLNSVKKAILKIFW